MPIIIIKGPAQSGKSLIANALRNNQVALKQGALLIDESNDGEVAPLLEKILQGVALREGVPATEQAWKPSCAVILVGSRDAMLDEFERLAPGFAALHGPVFTITTGRQ